MARSLPEMDVKKFLRIKFPVAATDPDGRTISHVDIHISDKGGLQIPKVTVEDGVGNLTLKQYEAIEAAAQEVVNNEFLRSQITVEMISVSEPVAARW